jgi:hypothetical protein
VTDPIQTKCGGAVGRQCDGSELTGAGSARNEKSSSASGNDFEAARLLTVSGCGRRAKARGVVLGNLRLADVRDRAVASMKADADRFARNVAPVIREIQLSGVAPKRPLAGRS